MCFLMWISRHAKDLSLTLTRVKDISQIIPQFWDFHAEINLRGRRFVGRGRAWSEEEAVSKACGEAIERAVFGVSSGSNENTNGWALGLSRQEAQKRALTELCERDAFLCHYYSGIPFITSGIAKKSNFGAYLDRLCRDGVEVIVARMRTANGLHGSCVAAFGEKAASPFGVVVGLGCAEDFEVACDKAYIECLTHLSAVLDGKLAPLTFESFQKLSRIEPEDHGRLALSSESLPFVRPLFSFATDGVKERSHVSIQLVDVELPAELSDAPVFVCRASSAQLQQLCFGGQISINATALRDFCGGELRSVTGFPHPLA